MKLRNYATAVTGLASSILTANLMWVFTEADALEVAIVTSVVASASVLLVLLDSEQKKKKAVKRTIRQETSPEYELREVCPIYTLDRETWGNN